MSSSIGSNASAVSGETSPPLPASVVPSPSPSPASNAGAERGQYLLQAVQTEYGREAVQPANQPPAHLDVLVQFYDSLPAPPTPPPGGPPPAPNDTLTPVDGHPNVDLRRLVLAVEYMVTSHPENPGGLDFPAHWRREPFGDLFAPFSRRLDNIETELTKSSTAPPATLTTATITAALENFRAQTAVTAQAILTIQQMTTTNDQAGSEVIRARLVARRISDAQAAFEAQVASAPQASAPSQVSTPAQVSAAPQVTAAAQQSPATQESAAAETQCDLCGCGLPCACM